MLSVVQAGNQNHPYGPVDDSWTHSNLLQVNDARAKAMHSIKCELWKALTRKSLELVSFTGHPQFNHAKEARQSSAATESGANVAQNKSPYETARF